jgi:uncharacterized RDD family membrane protein YckC
VHDDDLPTYPPPPGPAVAALAPLGRRFAAWLLDGLVLTPVMALLLVWSGFDPDTGIDGVSQATLSVFWLVLVAYQVGFIARSGQTIGKRLLRLRVVDATTGAVPDLDQAGRRAAPFLVQIVPVVGAFGYLLYVPALWHPRRQGLHDRLAHTIVVNA